ncbi:MAG: glycosyltransferase [Solirubrobacterales bacterium]|nr:glycosyltransferase [Solirubrobacterales bacterium]
MVEPPSSAADDPAVRPRAVPPEHIGELELSLHAPLSERIPTGIATTVFLAGTCSHPTAEIQRLEVVVGAERHVPDAWGMPRAGASAAWSGFWATIPVAAQAQVGTLPARVEALLNDGRVVSAPAGAVEVHEPAPPPSLAAGVSLQPETVAICMATYNPDPEMFAIQIESIREQSIDDWICLISDDASAPGGLALIERTVAGDPRFVVSHSADNRGFYRNFERALEMVPAGISFVALSDQDDRWYPDKLATLRAAIGDAQLVYSDLRLVDPDGSVVADTLWGERRTNHTNLASLMIANTVTGAAALFRRDLLDLALPFPEGPAGWKFHDHWLGGVALASGEVTFVDRPLYDYVQHREAILKGRISGDAEAASGIAAAVVSLARPRLREVVASWKSPYFFGYRVLAFQARALQVRCAPVLSRRKERALRLLLAAERSPHAFAWLVLRPLRGVVGRDETLGMERTLAKGILWRWLVGLRRRLHWSPGGTAYDASLPAFDPKDFGTVRPRWWPRGRGSP